MRAGRFATAAALLVGLFGAGPALGPETAFSQTPTRPPRMPWEAMSDWVYYNNTGWIAYNRGRYDRAEQAFRAAIKRLQPYEADHLVMMARSRADLGRLLVDRKRYTEAEPLVRWSLAVRESSPGEKSESLIQNLELLAQIRRAQGKHAEAGPLLKRALALQERILGHDHPELTTTLEALAEVSSAQGQTREAEALYRRALGIRESNTAANLKEAEKLEERAELLNELFASQRATMATQNIRTNQIERLKSQAATLRSTTSEARGAADANEGLARVLRATGRNEEADDREAQAKAIRDTLETRAARARAGRP